MSDPSDTERPDPWRIIAALLYARGPDAVGYAERQIEAAKALGQWETARMWEFIRAVVSGLGTPDAGGHTIH